MIGALIGIPLARGLAVRLGDLLYGVGPFDPLTVGTVLGTMVIGAASASFVPARRATPIDHVKTMRRD